MRAASVSELKDLIKLIADSEMLVAKLMDGLSFDDIGQLMIVAQDLPAALKDSSLMIPEFISLDDAARADLLAYVQANCKFPGNLSIEDSVQKVLKLLIMLSSAFQLVKVKAAQEVVPA